MAELEKVIKGIHQHCEGSMFDRCGECPYYEIDHEPFVCRDMLLNDLNELLKKQEHKDRMYHALEDDWRRLKELLKEQEVKTGKWIERIDYMGDTYYDCSVCNESWITIEGTPWVNGMNYCPHCGAKMNQEGR